MENTSTENDGRKTEVLVQCPDEEMRATEQYSLSKKSLRKLEPAHLLLLNQGTLETSESWSTKLLIPSIGGFGKIPKHIISLDERYFLRYLELTRTRGLRAASCDFSSGMHVIADSFFSTQISNRVMDDIAGLVNVHHLNDEAGNVLVSSTGDWILGTITGSESMMNILKSPLLNKSHTSERDAGLLANEIQSLVSMSSPGGLSISSSQKPRKEPDFLGSHGRSSESFHKRLVSGWSTNSTSSDQTSSSLSSAVSQGMLKCRWKDGLPFYVFALDDRREVYLANSVKIESAGDKFLDYVYMFRSRSDDRGQARETDTNVVGKMRVSTSFVISSSNSEVMETQFVLSGCGDRYTGEMHNPSHSVRRNKGLKNKVVDVFRTSKSYKQRNPSKFGGTSVILEDPKVVRDNLDQSEADTIEHQTAANLELAAIIVKEHIDNNQKPAEMGGWGLKFLKKSIPQGNADNRSTSVSSDSCVRNCSDCSTSMDVLVPAGFHGGLRTKNGGPTTLTERWRSGGQCDCGGWDIGCPLTVLKVRPNRSEALTEAGIAGDCRTFDLFIQGSKQASPMMKMVNVHDGLYYIHFQTNLSALQCFAIATAIIHTHSPSLRPQVYRS